MDAVLGDRSLFPALAARSYLNHAAVSPLSLPVQRAAVDAMASVAADGVKGVIDGLEARETLRDEVAAWLEVGRDDIGFPPGTTRGILDVALAIPWRRGDRVIVFEGEFPSNVIPWMQAMERCGGEVVRLPLEGFGDGSGLGLQRVDDVLARGGVRLIAVSAVQFASGLRMPLAALAERAHAHDAELFVDAIQALGVVPLSAKGVDYLVAGSHKWLMGTDGVAIAAASPAARSRLAPQTAGWIAHEDGMRFLTEAGQLRYDRPIRSSLDWMEGGTQSMPTFASLHAALRLLWGLSIPEIYAHVQRLHDALEGPLQALGLESVRATDPEARSGSLCFRPPQGVPVGDLSRGLAQRGVMVGTPDGHLRLSPHWPNALAEADGVVQAMTEVLRDAAP